MEKLIGGQFELGSALESETGDVYFVVDTARIGDDGSVVQVEEIGSFKTRAAAVEAALVAVRRDLHHQNERWDTVGVIEIRGDVGEFVDIYDRSGERIGPLL